MESKLKIISLKTREESDEKNIYIIWYTIYIVVGNYSIYRRIKYKTK